MVRSLPRRQVLAALLAVPSWRRCLPPAAIAATRPRRRIRSPPIRQRQPHPPIRPSPAPRRRSPTALSTWPSCSSPARCPNRSIGKAERQGDDRRIRLDDLPALRAFPRDDAAELKTKYIDTGKVRLIFREFPFDPRAEAGFMLARCSDDNYFPMVDVLFKQQMQLGRRRERQGRAAADRQARRFYTREVRGLLDGPEASGGCQGGARRGARRISASIRRRPSSSMAKPVSWSDVD